MNREERRQLEREIKKNKRGKQMKTYDITEKLNFEDNPKIKIKNVEVEVISDAKTIIQAIALLDSSDDNVMAVIDAYGLLFSEADQKKIDKLKLKPEPFMAFLRYAVAVATGQDIDEETEGNE